MKIGDMIEALQYFILDLIGVIIPGLSFVIGLGVVFKANVLAIPFIPDSYQGIPLILLSYAVGHLVTSIGDLIYIPLFGGVACTMRKIPIVKNIVPASIKPNKIFLDEMLKSYSFSHFIDEIKRTPYYSSLLENMDAKNLNHWRDIAMTIAKDEKNIVYKFMFISLLTSGMGTVLITISVLWGIFSLLVHYSVFRIDIVTFNPLIAIMLVIISFPFFERSASFYEMSMRVAFPIATVKVISDSVSSIKQKTDEFSSKENGTSHSKPRMYLAGGFKSSWQNDFINELPFFNYYDPRVHGISEEKGYTLWDLEAIKNCEWLFAYLEKKNPAGYALALEIGYAKALGKKIILVDEKSKGNSTIRKYLGMLHSSADIRFSSLRDAIAYLKTLKNLYYTEIESNEYL